jgi:hypothetical protein
VNHYGIVFESISGAGRVHLSVAAEMIFLAIAKARRVSGLSDAGIEGWEVVSVERLQRAGRGIPTTAVTMWRAAQTKRGVLSVETMRAEKNGLTR